MVARRSVSWFAQLAGRLESPGYITVEIPQTKKINRDLISSASCWG